MNPKEIIINALRRADNKERGLIITTPNDNLCSGHAKKANHNLVVMTDLSKLGHEDWVAIVAYYAMYQSSLSLLAKIGLQSKEHATTVAVLEYFFGKQIGRELIEKFNGLKEKKDKIEAVTIEEKYIDYLWKAKSARETVQYGISINYKETGVIMSHAREFASKIKIVLSELDEKIIGLVNSKIKNMRQEIIQ